MAGKLIPFPITIKDGYVINSEIKETLSQASLFVIDYKNSKKIPINIIRRVLISDNSCAVNEFEICIDKTSCSKVLPSGNYKFSANDGYAVRESDGVYEANIFIEPLNETDALIMASY